MWLAQSLEFLYLHLSEMILFLPHGSREPNERNGRLNNTGAVYMYPVIRGNTHRPTNQRPRFIDATPSILLQGWARPCIEPFDQSVTILLGPLVDETIRVQPWCDDCECHDLLRCCPFDPLPVLIWERSETPLNFLPVENRHRKQAETTVGAALSTGEIA
jgi:hypothetical protein